MLLGTIKNQSNNVFEAGLNVRTTFNHPKNFVMPLRALVREGKLSEKIIDQRVREILWVKFKEKLFDKPYRDEQLAIDTVRQEKHLALALDATRQTVVLLKNKHAILPLKKDKIKNILVCGPAAKYTASSISRYGALGVNVITGLEGIQTALAGKATVTYALGSDFYSKDWPHTEILPVASTKKEKKMIAQAVKKAEKVDVVIVFLGENEKMVGENLSRSSLQLPVVQKRLFRALKKTKKPTVVVLANGRPLAINEINRDADAILSIGFSGEYLGQAVADVIFGDYNPAGCLAMTWPKHVGQIPLNFPHKFYSQSGQAKKGPHGIGESRIVPSLYPFGYGLSYSKFHYDQLTIDAKNLTTRQGHLEVSCKIKNTSDYDGDKVVQLYLRDKLSSVATYRWSLKDFVRVHLKAGQRKIVKFKVPYHELALINIAFETVIEPGDFEVAVGCSSVNFKLKGSFEIKE